MSILEIKVTKQYVVRNIFNKNVLHEKAQKLLTSFIFIQNVEKPTRVIVRI